MPTITTRVPKPYWFGSLSDHTLLRQLHDEHERDRARTARLVALMAEVEKRRLYRPEGYASLFKFCVGALGMTEDMAWKRIQAARVARRYPAILAMLADGRLTLTAVVLLDPHLMRANAAELLKAAAHRSKREVQELLAARFPQPDLASRITPIPLAPTSAQPASSPVESCATPPAPERVPALSCMQAAAHVATAAAPAAAPPVELPAQHPRITPLSPGRFALQVTLSQATHDKLRRVQELLGHKIPSQDLAQVLDHALELALRHLEHQRFARTSQPRKARSAAKGRHVPASIRREVWERDGGRCSFVSESGHQCEARSRLEYDHVTPVARGGQTTAANLRLRCRAHNQLAAEQVFGTDFMIAKRLRAGRLPQPGLLIRQHPR